MSKDRKQLLTTGQAAKLCSVTPDTVLKWIRSGRLPAYRTPGGHHRIERANLDRIVASDTKGAWTETGDSVGRHFQYCWEYNGNGSLQEGCAQCLVYQMRAQRCYQVVERAQELGHKKVFCQKSCLECDYYRSVHQQDVNMLVVTDNDILSAYLKRSQKLAPFNLEITDCEYNCSLLVDDYKPDYVIIDCSLGMQRARDFGTNVAADPRIPHVRVIMAAEPEEVPNSCDKDVFAWIKKPFGIDEIVECLGSARRAAG